MQTIYDLLEQLNKEVRNDDGSSAAAMRIGSIASKIDFEAWIQKEIREGDERAGKKLK